MKAIQLVLASVLVCFSYMASASSWHEHSGRSYHKNKQKVEYWDGKCKVKREYKKNGSYKEKRSCKPTHHYNQRPNYRSYHKPQYGVNLPTIVINPTIRIN